MTGTTAIFHALKRGTVRPSLGPVHWLEKVPGRAPTYARGVQNIQKHIDIRIHRVKNRSERSPLADRDEGKGKWRIRGLCSFQVGQNVFVKTINMNGMRNRSV